MSTAWHVKSETVKILLAEDNESNRLLIQEILNSLGGYQIEFAENGREAVKLVGSKSYDLCLMDIQMPVMGGIEATKIIREHVSRDLPIVALSAAVLPEDKEKALNAGMNDFLKKPINFNELQACINKHLKKSA